MWPRMHRTLFVLAILTATLSAAPPNWTTHTNPQGFTLQHPPGWTVETPEKNMVVIHDPGGAVQAIAYGFMTRPEITAAQWLEGMPTRFPNRFQKVALDRIAQTRPTQALVDMRYSSRLGDGRARVLCSLNRGAGMMFAIAAPVFRFDEFSRDLIAILQTFQVTQSQGGQQGGTGQSQPQRQNPLAGVEWTRWSDPVENAISMEVPRGWRAEGGTVRRGSVDVHQSIRTTSPDGIMIFSGDPDQHSYVLPTQTMAMGGWREGSLYSPGYGSQFIVMRYTPGVAFAEQWARRLGAAQIRERKSRDDLAAEANAANRGAGAGVVQNQTTVGEVSFSTQSGSAGWVIATTQVTASAEMGGMWFVTGLLGYVAPPNRVQTAGAVLAHMIQTFQVNPQWFQGQQQTISQTSRTVSETANAMAKIASDSYWGRQASQDSSAQNYSDMQRGIQVVVDPNTGQKYEAVSGHNYYYLAPNQGVVVSADQQLPANIDVTELTPTRR